MRYIRTAPLIEALRRSLGCDFELRGRGLEAWSRAILTASNRARSQCAARIRSSWRVPVRARDEFSVFLSHNRTDRPAVRQLYQALRERRVNPWFDEEHLVPGQSWQAAIEDIICGVPAAAVLIGKDGVGPWEEPEIHACLCQYAKRRLPVIPVLLPGASKQPPLPLFLRGFHGVDFRWGLSEDGLDRLVWGITGSRP